MLFTLEPDPIHVSESGVLHLQLSPGEPEARYRFQFDLADKIFDGGVSAYVELDMEQGEDRDVEVVFPTARAYTVQFFEIGTSLPLQSGATYTVLEAVSAEPSVTVALAAPPRPITPDEVLL